MKIKRLKAGSRAWIKEATQVAILYAPIIYPCGKCNYPVVDGYVCINCNDSAPYQDKNGYTVEKDGWL